VDDGEGDRREKRPALMRRAHEAVLAAEELLAAEAWGLIQLDEICRAAGIPRSTALLHLKAREEQEREALAEEAEARDDGARRYHPRATLAHELIGRWRGLLAEKLDEPSLEVPQDIAELVSRLESLAQEAQGSLVMAWGMATWSGKDPLARDTAQLKWTHKLSGLARRDQARALVAPILVDVLLRRLQLTLPPLDPARFATRFLYGWLPERANLESFVRRTASHRQRDALDRLILAVGRWGVPTPNGRLDLTATLANSNVSRGTLHNHLGRVPSLVLDLVSELLTSFESALTSANFARLECLVEEVTRTVADFAAVWPILLVTDHAPAAAKRLHAGAAALLEGLLDVCPPVVPPEERGLFLLMLLGPLLVPRTPQVPEHATPFAWTASVLLGAVRASRMISASEHEVQDGQGESPRSRLPDSNGGEE